MSDYATRGIKEIIDACPEVEKILKAYDIGCGACDVGTCRLMDIVSFHPLTETQQQELMSRIEAAIERNESP